MRKLKYIIFGALLGAALFAGYDYISDYWPMIRQFAAGESMIDAASSASERPADEEIYGDFGDVTPEEAAELEDLSASGTIDTTLDINKSDEDWLNQAIDLTSAVNGDTYINLDSGILTVNQLNAFLKAMPFELSFVDSNNQFLYYNHNKDSEDMFVPRDPIEIGDPLGGSHPDMIHNYVAWVVYQLRTGAKDAVHIAVPTGGEDQFIVHTYKRMEDENGEYLGINQYVQDLQPIVNWYLQQTNQKLSSQ